MVEVKLKMPKNSLGLSDFEHANLMKAIDAECQRLRDMLREGKITSEEYQSAMKEIFWTSKSQRKDCFFTRIQNELDQMVSVKTDAMARPENINVWSSIIDKVEKDLILKENWFYYWTASTWLSYPTSEDVETIPKLQDCEVVKYISLLAKSLKDMVDAQAEQDPKTQMLYEYYKLLKAEARTRPMLNVLVPQEDGFLDYTTNKSEYDAINQQLKDARVTGEICIHCGSTDVHSYNKKKWHCHTCGRYFNKK